MKKAAKSEEGKEDEAEEDSEKKVMPRRCSTNFNLGSEQEELEGGAGQAEADPPVSASFVLACCTCSIEMRSAFCPKDLCQIKEKKGRER